MNKSQKNIIIFTVIMIAFSFAFPPYAYFSEGGTARRMGYSFISNVPYGASVYILMLFSEWLGLSLISGLLYFYFSSRMASQEGKTSHGQNGFTSQDSTRIRNNPANEELKEIDGWVNIILHFSLLLIVFVGVNSISLDPLSVKDVSVFYGKWFVICSLLMGYYLWVKKASSIQGKSKTIVVAVILFLIIKTVASLVGGYVGKQDAENESISAIESQEFISPNGHESRAEHAARLYKSGDYKQAFPLIERLANDNHVPWQVILGQCYELGLGVEQNYQTAAIWYSRAAEQGDSEAQNLLGILYYTGRGVTQNSELGLNWLQKSAGQGNDNAINNIRGLKYSAPLTVNRGTGDQQGYRASGKKNFDRKNNCQISAVMTNEDYIPCGMKPPN